MSCQPMPVIHEFYVTCQDGSQHFIIIYNRTKTQAIKFLDALFVNNPITIFETLY